jgi:peptidoglycan/xylan/chitin deacetylase (PgdA/CDA1 family)
VGVAAEKNPQLVRAEVAAGNAIGNHTYHHIQPFKSIPEWEVATEIKANGEVIKSITGTAPHLFRPPGGGFNDSISTVSTALGYTTVMWTDDPGDFDPTISAQKLLDRLLKRVDNGAVILLHDGGKHTLEILPPLISTLQQRGYQFVTVDELIRQSH